MIYILVALVLIAVLWLVMSSAVEQETAKKITRPRGWPTWFPYDEDIKASPKKIEELNELNDWLKSLVREYGFKVKIDWGNDWPREKVLEISNDKHGVFVEADIDVSGQNYDRVGKIEVYISWAKYHEDDHQKDIEKEQTMTLATAMKRIPSIVDEVRY